MLSRTVQETIVRNRLPAGKFVFISLSGEEPLIIADSAIVDREWIKVFHGLARYIGIPTRRFSEEIMLKLFEQEEEKAAQLTTT